MIEGKLADYPWLVAQNGKLACRYCIANPAPGILRKKGSGPSQEWTSYSVGYDKANAMSSKDKLTKLRKKIKLHKDSHAHKSSEKTFLSKKNKTSSTVNQLAEGWKQHTSSTEHVFRLAYLLAKLDRPYTDFPQLVDCHQLNGADMGCTLHSEKSCQNIIGSISSDIRSRICEHIISQKPKISIMVDKSTRIATKSCLVIHLRANINSVPTNIFLDLVELPDTLAKNCHRHYTENTR